MQLDPTTVCHRSRTHMGRQLSRPRYSGAASMRHAHPLGKRLRDPFAVRQWLGQRHRSPAADRSQRQPAEPAMDLGLSISLDSHPASLDVLHLARATVAASRELDLLQHVLVGGDDDDGNGTRLREVERLEAQADVGHVKDRHAQRAARGLSDRGEVLEGQPSQEAIADNGGHSQHRVVVPSQPVVAGAAPPQQRRVAWQRAVRCAERSWPVAEELRRGGQRPTKACQWQDHEAGGQHRHL
mmetsp:Transcript_28509/g.72140  ORF Transcript_28509/g.72140 Transcript_28509/m.72140 type:complete len:241 (+) Transcript_28509:223-945(+)